MMLYLAEKTKVQNFKMWYHRRILKAKCTNATTNTFFKELFGREKQQKQNTTNFWNVTLQKNDYVN